MTAYKITKVVTNNLVRAKDINDSEVILTGKGIGFKRNPNDIIPSENVEHVFELKDKHESNLYDQLILNTSPKIIEIANSIIVYIQSNFKKKVNDHIHIALTDHICFLVRRYKMGIPIENPFDYESDILYPRETAIARQVVKMLNDELNIEIPDSEASFIALHIITSLSDNTILNIQKNSLIIKRLITTLENFLDSKLDRNSLNYARLTTHFRFMLERIERNEELKIPKEIEALLKKEYPVCYSLAWKLIKMVQQELKKNILESEVVCLSIHLYRFTENEKENASDQYK